MKKTFTTVVILASFFFCSAQSTQTFLDFGGTTIEGDPIDFSKFAGKKLMIVNTASECGYTPQFEQLENIYKQYGGEHFEIIGFPSDDFNQELATNGAVQEFCTANYGVTFQMMSIGHVIKDDTMPVYKWLQLKSLNGVADKAVTWNFNKFLIDEAGHWVKYYPRETLPDAPAIVTWITSVATSASVVNADLEIILQNPVSDFFTIQLNDLSEGNLSIKLFSLSGSEVGNIFQGSYSRGQVINYPVSGLSAGLYFIKVQSAEQSNTYKVAVVK